MGVPPAVRFVLLGRRVRAPRFQACSGGGAGLPAWAPQQPGMVPALPGEGGDGRRGLSLAWLVLLGLIGAVKEGLTERATPGARVVEGDSVLQFASLEAGGVMEPHWAFQERTVLCKYVTEMCSSVKTQSSAWSWESLHSVTWIS